jgi:two-component SAPR family response regulator
MKKIPATVSLASDAAFAINSRGRVVAWNSRAEQLLGYPEQEVMGRACGDILQAVLPGGEPLCGPKCELFGCFQNCVPRGVESCRMRRKNGDWVTVRYSSLITAKKGRRSRADSAIAIVFLHDKADDLVVPQAGSTLQVFTLGNFGLTIGGESVALEKWVRKQSVTLLKYLVTQAGRPMHRERILGCLWPEADAGRGWDRLKVAISYLRNQLRGMGMAEDALTTVGKAYLLRRDAIRVDADIFENFIAEGRALQAQQNNQEALRCYTQADHLYRGDYLEQEIFADWCAEERERLRELHLDMLVDMVQCYVESGDFGEAARLCRKALVHEPCRESFHRTLMECLVFLGHTDQALAQYQACRNLLRQELGVDPMPETQRIFQQILKRGVRSHEHPVSIQRLDLLRSVNS